MKQLPVGVMAPEFILQTSDGQAFRLSEQVQHGPVVLAFFKISCPTCQFTFPYLQQIYNSSPPESGGETRQARRGGSKTLPPKDTFPGPTPTASPGLRIYGVSQDDIEDTRAFAHEFGVHFPILIDEHPHSVSSSYGLEYVPAIFIVGSEGRIQLSDYGFSKATLSEIAKPQQLFSADDGIPATRPG
jgi:peroxiredoxin